MYLRIGFEKPLQGSKSYHRVLLHASRIHDPVGDRLESMRRVGFQVAIL